MEYEAKGTLEGGTAKMYTIEDKSKINHTLQVGDYFVRTENSFCRCGGGAGECDWYCLLCG